MRGDTDKESSEERIRETRGGGGVVGSRRFSESDIRLERRILIPDPLFHRQTIVSKFLVTGFETGIL